MLYSKYCIARNLKLALQNFFGNLKFGKIAIDGKCLRFHLCMIVLNLVKIYIAVRQIVLSTNYVSPYGNVFQYCCTSIIYYVTFIEVLHVN